MDAVVTRSLRQESWDLVLTLTASSMLRGNRVYQTKQATTAFAVTLARRGLSATVFGSQTRK